MPDNNAENQPNHLQKANREKKKKYALVTGGGRGIGRAVALRLAQEGYQVAITCRSSVQGAKDLQAELLRLGSDTQVYQADLSDLDQLNRAFDQYMAHYPALDVLVNNAGATIEGGFLQTTPEQFNACVATDLRAPFFMAQRAAKYMIEKDTQGLIVNIASNQGISTFENYPVYGSVKAGLIKLSKHMALELARYGIRVNTVSPGYTNVGWGGTDQPASRKLQKMIPLGGFGRPEQVAGIVAFLTTADAGYMTGANLLADGGLDLPVRADVPVSWIPDSILED